MPPPLTTRFADFKLRQRPATSARGPITDLPASLQKYLDGARRPSPSRFAASAGGQAPRGLFPI